jgi:tRNA-specific 2-thiouridylase
MGHYARKEERAGVTHLLRGKDNNKDQSYFLSQLTSEQLKRVLFPIGELSKKEVRERAFQQKLAVYDKKDSTGICFIGERDFELFLANYLPAQKGLMKTIDGKVIKEHNGLYNYTIGQRKGLDIGGLKDYPPAPWFVIGKDLSANVLYVGQGYHNEYLYSNNCIVKDVVFRGDKDLENRFFTAKFRYRSEDVKVTLEWLDETTLKVIYPDQERAVTPGQAAAFYEGEVCVGGGFIDQVYFDQERRLY